MRVVALEEHFALPSFRDELAPNLQRTRPDELQTRLNELGPLRLRSMDDNGITLQVLSVPVAEASQVASPELGPDFARRYNDALAGEARKYPERFRTFAHLPLLTPEAAADELERSVRELGALGALVSGTTRGKFLDDARFAPLLARSEELDVPIYIHPAPPPVAVREAYYDGFDPEVSRIFAASAWGWHIETAIHVIRMVLAGTFDRHPKLKVIVGHMGEALPFMLDRLDERLTPVARNLSRGVAETILDHVVITTAGFFTLPPFMTALQTFGADRILFSVDYPFSSTDAARRFLDNLPVAPSDKEKIAHGNADRLLRLKA